jgi:acyl-coenzyme A thioesterase PaaI-like protein
MRPKRDPDRIEYGPCAASLGIIGVAFPRQRRPRRGQSQIRERRGRVSIVSIMASPSPVSVQEKYAPASRCFGCGPANTQGLHLRSFPSHQSGASEIELHAQFQPAPHHLAFEGIVNGGIIGALLDCHSNWTAAVALMRRLGSPTPPCTVTADFHVTLKRPTPIDQTLTLRAHPVQISDDRAVIEATLEAAGHLSATCRGTFVAVKEGHPAFHRW